MLEFYIKYSNKNFSLETNLSFPEKGLTCILGPSGCGKTTLIRSIAGLEKPQEANIKIANEVWQSEDIFKPTHLRKIGMVFQDNRLFPHLSVKENLLYGFNRNKNTDALILLDEVVEMLSISDLLDRSTQELSGGQAQRVAIGRALLRNPDLLLFDEPLASLDFKVKKQIVKFLIELKSRLNIPMLYVTHSLKEASELADHLIYIDDGKVIKSGKPKKILDQLIKE